MAGEVRKEVRKIIQHFESRNRSINSTVDLHADDVLNSVPYQPLKDEETLNGESHLKPNSLSAIGDKFTGMNISAEKPFNEMEIEDKSKEFTTLSGPKDVIQEMNKMKRSLSVYTNLEKDSKKEDTIVNSTDGTLTPISPQYENEGINGAVKAIGQHMKGWRRSFSLRRQNSNKKVSANSLFGDYHVYQPSVKNGSSKSESSKENKGDKSSQSLSTTSAAKRSKSTNSLSISVSTSSTSSSSESTDSVETIKEPVLATIKQFDVPVSKESRTLTSITRNFNRSRNDVTENFDIAEKDDSYGDIEMERPTVNNENDNSSSYNETNLSDSEISCKESKVHTRSKAWAARSSLNNDDSSSSLSDASYIKTEPKINVIRGVKEKQLKQAPQSTTSVTDMQRLVVQCRTKLQKQQLLALYTIVADTDGGENNCGYLKEDWEHVVDSDVESLVDDDCDYPRENYTSYGIAEKKGLVIYLNERRNYLSTKLSRINLQQANASNVASGNFIYNRPMNNYKIEIPSSNIVTRTGLYITDRDLLKRRTMALLNIVNSYKEGCTFDQSKRNIPSPAYNPLPNANGPKDGLNGLLNSNTTNTGSQSSFNPSLPLAQPTGAYVGKWRVGAIIQNQQIDHLTFANNSTANNNTNSDNSRGSNNYGPFAGNSIRPPIPPGGVETPNEGRTILTFSNATLGVRLMNQRLYMSLVRNLHRRTGQPGGSTDPEFDGQPSPPAFPPI